MKRRSILSIAFLAGTGLPRLSAYNKRLTPTQRRGVRVLTWQQAAAIRMLLPTPVTPPTCACSQPLFCGS